MNHEQKARALRLADEMERGQTLGYSWGVLDAANLLRELAAEPVRQWLGPYTDAWTALNELRRAVAEVIGADPDVWPTHGNAPLAIAASVATRQMELKKRDAASAEPVRVPLTDEQGIALANAVSSPNDATWIRDPDQCVLRIVRATEVAHGITGDAK